ncbi:hypothetical protein EYR26_16920 [Xanthomonas oryzae]|nr:hypothetical protein EYR26_16920 [Xanthomonas oryzae]
MVRVLLLQQLYNLSDDALEYQLLDRCSVVRFVGLEGSGKVPDAKTIWVWRERLKNKHVIGDISAAIRGATGARRLHCPWWVDHRCPMPDVRDRGLSHGRVLSGAGRQARGGAQLRAGGRARCQTAAKRGSPLHHLAANPAGPACTARQAARTQDRAVCGDLSAVGEHAARAGRTAGCTTGRAAFVGAPGPDRIHPACWTGTRVSSSSPGTRAFDPGGRRILPQGGRGRP